MTFKQRWSIILCLTIGNFLWQVVTGQDWMEAAERSYFQAVAVLITSWVCFENEKRLLMVIEILHKSKESLRNEQKRNNRQVENPVTPGKADQEN